MNKKDKSLMVVDKLQKLAIEVKEQFTEGLVSGKDALLLYGGIKALSKLMDEVSKNSEVKETIISEFDKYGEKSLTLDNLNFSKRRYTTYSYEEVDHPMIDMEMYINQLLADYVKEAKDKAKSLTNSTSVSTNTKVVIDKSDIERLKESIDTMFDTFLDSFESDSLVISINPAKVKSSSESLICKFK